MGQQSSKSELPSKVADRLAEIAAARKQATKLYMPLDRLSFAETRAGISAAPGSVQDRSEALKLYLRQLNCEEVAIFDCLSECRPSSLL